jgi:hypothetical protein
MADKKTAVDVTKGMKMGVFVVEYEPVTASEHKRKAHERTYRHPGHTEKVAARDARHAIEIVERIAINEREQEVIDDNGDETGETEDYIGIVVTSVSFEGPLDN